MYFKSLLVAFFILLFSACSGGNSVDLKEGKWNITTTMNMPGMPFQVPPITVTQCLTQKDFMPEQQEADDSSCKIINQQVKGSTITWEMECPNSKSSTTITYKHDKFNGATTMKTTTPSGIMNMSSTIEGKYIGLCD